MRKRVKPTEPNGLLIKQGQGTEDLTVPYRLRGIPAREPEDYYITELYHKWLDECRKAKSFAPSKPDVVFHAAFKLGLEYALNHQPVTDPEQSKGTL